MKKKIIGLILFVFILVISNNIFGVTIDVGKELTFSFSELTENGNVPSKITSASSGDSSIVSVEELKDGWWPFKSIYEIKVKGLKAGTTNVTIYAEYDTYTTDIYGSQVKTTELRSKSFTIEVIDANAEAEIAKAEQQMANIQQLTDSKNQQLIDMENAYKTIPGDNASFSEIDRFIESDSKHNELKNFNTVKLETLEKWTDAYAAIGDRWVFSTTSYNLIIARANYLRSNNESSFDSSSYQEKLNEEYDSAKEGIQNSIDEYEAKIAELNILIDKSREDRGDVFLNDVLEDINQYKPDDMDSKSSKMVEDVTSQILTSVTNIGILVSVIILAILGIKYMIGSVEEKAEYKKDLIPYLIGALILFGITSFVKILMALGDEIGNI